MKKILSFGLAMAMTAAMAVTAFAADVMNISFDFVNSDGADLSTENLRPNEEYRFPVLVQYGDEEPSHLTKEEMEGKRFAVTLQKGGTAVQTPVLEEDGGKYYLVVNTKANYAVKTTDVEFQVRLSNKSTGREIDKVSVQLTVGFPKMPDSALEGLGEGDSFPVDNATPIITAKQFEKLAKLNSYKAVTLSGDGWEYTVNVTDLPELNLYASSAAITEIVKKYENQEFKFLNFAAGPDFGVKGTLSINVSDVEDEFGGEFYLYRYLGGRLYFLNSEYSEGDGTVTFRPSQLGTYVLTDKKLSDVEVGGSGGAGGSSSSGSSNSSGNSGSTGSGSSGSGEPNPETGDNSVAGIAAALALAALASAAAVSKKRK